MMVKSDKNGRLQTKKTKFKIEVVVGTRLKTNEKILPNHMFVG